MSVLSHAFCYCTQFNCLIRPKFFYIIHHLQRHLGCLQRFQLWQCCPGCPGPRLVGARARVSLQDTAGVESLGQDVWKYPILYKIMPNVCRFPFLPESCARFCILFNTWYYQNSKCLQISELQDGCDLQWSWFVFPQLFMRLTFLYLYLAIYVSPTVSCLILSFA